MSGLTYLVFSCHELLFNDGAATAAASQRLPPEIIRYSSRVSDNKAFHWSVASRVAASRALGPQLPAGLD